MKDSLYFRTFIVVTLLLLLAALLAVTRLRLIATQIDQVRVVWDASVQPSSERALALDALIRQELETAVEPHVLSQLQRQERVVSTRRLWVDRCETRQQDFNNFVSWYRNTPEDEDMRDFIAAPDEPEHWNYASVSTTHRTAARPQSPASGVSYFDAYAYCRASGGRLPSDIEWQLVAGGREARLYPWGNDFVDHEKAWPYRDGVLNAAQICALHPDTDTPRAIHDLANGVMEWSVPSVPRKELLEPPSEYATLHGALPDAVKGRAVYALVAVKHRLPKHLRSHRIGFRCVYERQPVRATSWGARYSVLPVDSGEYLIDMPLDASLPRLLGVLPEKHLEKIVREEHTAENASWQEWRIDVARCETKRKHYLLFLRDPLVRFGFFANERQPAGTEYTPSDWQRQLENPELPVVGINWWAADAFARWVGGRLPSSAEWRNIAAGTQRHLYPWGSDYDPQHAMSADLERATPGDCGDFPNDVSANGVHNMGANVSEWTNSVTVGGHGYLMWVNGGSFLLPGRESAKTEFQRAVPLEHRASDIGFRVVFD